MVEAVLTVYNPTVRNSYLGRRLVVLPESSVHTEVHIRHLRPRFCSRRPDSGTVVVAVGERVVSSRTGPRSFGCPIGLDRKERRDRCIGCRRAQYSRLVSRWKP